MLSLRGTTRWSYWTRWQVYFWICLPNQRHITTELSDWNFLCQHRISPIRLRNSTAKTVIRQRIALIHLRPTKRKFLLVLKLDNAVRSWTEIANLISIEERLVLHRFAYLRTMLLNLDVFFWLKTDMRIILDNSVRFRKVQKTHVYSYILCVQLNRLIVLTLIN